MICCESTKFLQWFVMFKDKKRRFPLCASLIGNVQRYNKFIVSKKLKCFTVQINNAGPEYEMFDDECLTIQIYHQIYGMDIFPFHKLNNHRISHYVAIFPHLNLYACTGMRNCEQYEKGMQIEI